jgi:hypothetical protein
MERPLHHLLHELTGLQEVGMTLSPREFSALHNLADKQSGQDVDWINIADARALTERGLARRTRAGWEITSAGLALIKAQAGGGPTLVS